MDDKEPAEGDPQTEDIEAKLAESSKRREKQNQDIDALFAQWEADNTRRENENQRIAEIGASLMASQELERLQWGTSGEQEKSHRAPTKKELSRLMKEADSNSAWPYGRSVVEEFGRLAIEGSPEDRKRFHLLIQRKLGIELDEI